MTYIKVVGRLMVVIGIATSLQACSALANVRVAPLQPENSSSNRSMLSLYDPIHHRSASTGYYLRGSEDRNPRYRYLGY
jgi:hypothetical protein